MSKIQKLPQTLVNQIAAGEVVERPVSVVKELLDNAVDAGADRIEITIEDGGKKLIKINDNGIGIAKEELRNAVEAHSTSKISSIEDLNQVMTLGFRGEALSTIVSVSEFTIKSKAQDSDEAFQLAYIDGDEEGDIQPTAHNQGTTIEVKNLFSNIPARQKFLKKGDTEYNKIRQMLSKFFIIYPKIHFILNKDGREVQNLPAINTEDIISIDRIRDVYNHDFTEEMIPVNFNGNGVEIHGYVAHPKFHSKRTKVADIYINKRPLNDKALMKSVSVGFDRFIPHGEKVPFVLDIEINPEQVDINVHPRKEEVRFINPYRTYKYVEQAIQDAVKKYFKDNDTASDFSNPNAGSKNEVPSNYSTNSRSSFTPSRSSTNTQSSFNYNQTSSKNKISPKSLFRNASAPFQSESSELQDSGSLGNKSTPLTGIELENAKSVTQLFTKYIQLEFKDFLLIIDQHAAAERITFEKLLHHADELTTQAMLMPETVSVELDDSQVELVDLLLKDIGFKAAVSEDSIEISEIPTEFTKANLQSLFDELLSELEEHPEVTTQSLDNHRELYIATVACHNSIRTSQRLQRAEMLSQVEQLMNCDNPYACPHGRPIVWKLTIEDIDNNFDRTY